MTLLKRAYSSLQRTRSNCKKVSTEQKNRRPSL